MKNITLEELLEAGCHFGHQVNRRNPKADRYIFEARSGVHIINLEKTREGLLRAGEEVRRISESGGSIVFVGTKRQAKGIVREEIDRARSSLSSPGQATNEGSKQIFYVTSRWVGGTLTNFPEVSKNFKRLKELKELLASEKNTGYTKREMVLFEREKNKLATLYEGIEDLDNVPDALCIIGTQLETTAVSEAVSSGIESIGIVDTNADPSLIDFPIPANDDAVGSIKIITSYLVDAFIEGQKEKEKNDKVQQVKEAKEEAKNKAKEDKQKAKITPK